MQSYTESNSNTIRYTVRAILIRMLDTSLSLIGPGFADIEDVSGGKSCSVSPNTLFFFFFPGAFCLQKTFSVSITRYYWNLVIHQITLIQII